MWVGKLVA
jgi:hypothetical protein